MTAEHDEIVRREEQNKGDSETPNPTTKSTRVQNRTVRYAVIGLGFISQAAILPAFANAKENSEVVALVSSDKDKLKKLARKYKIKKTYTYEQYEDCLKSGEIDAAYIALPNNMHREYTEKAARAGIHVLCEKPMAITVEDCQAMIDAAERGKIKLMIAYRLHFEKGNLSAIQSVGCEEIGAARIYRSALCQQVAAGNTRLKADTGEDPLYDIGIYCINAARYLFRSEPEEVFAFGATGSDERFGEVEEMDAALMRFSQARLASFECSFGSSDRSMFEVIGTKGVLKMDPAFEMTGDLKSEITLNGKTRRMTYKKRDQFGPELVYFSNCILKNEEPEPNGREGMADIRIIEALLESKKTGRPIKLAPFDVQNRPTPDLEIQKPAREQPQMVKAASPSE